MTPIHSCRLRPMREADLAMVLDWRNQPHVRRCMYSTHAISMEEHQAWFARVSADGSQTPYLFEVDAKPIGFINFNQFDRERQVCSWGFYVGAEDAPRMAGSMMACWGLSEAFRTLGVRRVRGEVLASNARSLAFHRRLGFTEEGLLREQVLVDGQPSDVVLFGLLRREWEAQAPSILACLPVNPEG